MKEYIIKNNEAGQRFDKYLKKILPNASSSFIYKMLRKKNITLDGHKASGTEILKIGSDVKIFFSDETFDKFSVDLSALKNEYDALSKLTLSGLKIIFENDDILIADKPVNMLSQKSGISDISANERLIGYLISNSGLDFEEFKTFKPSVCNRLDRNTTGLILMGKSLKGSQYLSQILKERSIEKYYRTIVAGKVTEPQHIEGFLTKDKDRNIVKITDKKIDETSTEIKTEYRPIKSNNNVTLLEVHLITGKSHQIRAHLASIGHPIIGDPKYGDEKLNNIFMRQYKIKTQLLHAYKVVFPDDNSYIAQMPQIYTTIIDG
ncbi:MAG: RluA family pseudouridine synthase [Agathobacter sp.]|nr:RluA family pseudouridine synthase [Agathobacter sp.]